MFVDQILCHNITIFSHKCTHAHFATSKCILHIHFSLGYVYVVYIQDDIHVYYTYAKYTTNMKRIYRRRHVYLELETLQVE